MLQLGVHLDLKKQHQYRDNNVAAIGKKEQIEDFLVNNF